MPLAATPKGTRDALRNCEVSGSDFAYGHMYVSRRRGWELRDDNCHCEFWWVSEAEGTLLCNIVR